MQTFLQDFRYGVRMLLKKPGFTLIAILTLALGIGASTAIFSVVNVVILNPFPYRDHTRLVLVRQNLPKLGVHDQLRASGAEFADFAKSPVFERVAAWEPVSRNLTGGQEPERVAPAKVSAEFFSMLGIEPALGRTIRPDEQGPNGERVLVISHGLWQRRFGGDPGVLGKQVALDDEPYTIIGVMPPRFWFDGRDGWFPFPFNLGDAPRNSGRAFAILAKLKPGVSESQAKAELELLARQNEQAFASTNPEYVGRGIYLQPYRDFVYGEMRPVVLILLGAVGLVLLIACANIANLLLTRAASRAPEIAIRVALGASRWRIVRQLLTESLLLSIFGGGLGALIALWGIDAIVALVPAGSIPAGVVIGVDGRVLFFALGASLLTALLFGLWPALQISRPETQESLKAGAQRATASRRNRRMQNALVVAEVSLSLILLVMAGLMIRSFARLANVDTGFESENLLSMFRRQRRGGRFESGIVRHAGQAGSLLRDGAIGVALPAHEPGDPRRGRSHAPRQPDSARDLVGGQRSGGLSSADDGTDGRRLDRHAPVRNVAAPALCRPRRDARRHRHLRRDVLRRDRAHARDRRADGARRRRAGCVETDPPAGHATRVAGRGTWACGRARPDVDDEQPALRRKRDRSADLCGDYAAVDRSGHPGLLDSGAAGDESGSDGCASRRIDAIFAFVANAVQRCSLPHQGFCKVAFAGFP